MASSSSGDVRFELRVGLRSGCLERRARLQVRSFLVESFPFRGEFLLDLAFLSESFAFLSGLLLLLLLLHQLVGGELDLLDAQRWNSSLMRISIIAPELRDRGLDDRRGASSR